MSMSRPGRLAIFKPHKLLASGKDEDKLCDMSKGVQEI